MLPTDNQKKLAEQHTDERLAISLYTVGTELIAYHFWQILTPLVQDYERKVCVTNLTIEMKNDICNKEIFRQPQVFEEETRSPKFLCKKITKKHSAQLKVINMMGRRTTISLRLSGTYYTFGCKKYICKKRLLGGQVQIYGGHKQHTQKFCLHKLFLSARGRHRKYGVYSFCNCKGGLLNKNILVNNHRFNGAQKYLPKGMVPTMYIGHEHRLNMMKSCVRSCMGMGIERVDCLQAQIRRANVTNAKNLCHYRTLTMQKYVVAHRCKQDKGNVQLLQ